MASKSKKSEESVEERFAREYLITADMGGIQPTAKDWMDQKSPARKLFEKRLIDEGIADRHTRHLCWEIVNIFIRDDADALLKQELNNDRIFQNLIIVSPFFAEWLRLAIRNQLIKQSHLRPLLRQCPWWRIPLTLHILSSEGTHIGKMLAAEALFRFYNGWRCGAVRWRRASRELRKYYRTKSHL